jgi:hypothetical protein
MLLEQSRNSRLSLLAELVTFLQLSVSIIPNSQLLEN